VTDPPHRRAELFRCRFERILLIKPSSLGDVIHALPVLHLLRRKYPEARVDWLVNSAFAPLLEGHPDLNELVVFDRNRYGRMSYSPTVAIEFVRFLRMLRARQYDLVVDLQGLFRTGFLSWATRAPVRIGFAEAREGASLFYTDRIPPSSQDTHAVDRNMKVADFLDMASELATFHLPVSTAALATVRTMLGAGGWTAGEPLVAIVPGARWATKLWPVDRFAQIARELESEGVRCMILGGNNEAPLSGSFKRPLPTAVIDLIGRTKLPELVAAISLADVVLCQDSAAMHIAVALGRPLVCLVGPTNPLRTGPYRRFADVVQNPVECSPCYLRKLSQCKHEHRCMNELHVAPVLDAVRRRLPTPGHKPTRYTAVTVP